MPHKGHVGPCYRIYLVDDHAVFREGVTRILEAQSDLQFCGDSADAAAALQQIPVVKPDLVILDLALGGMNGLELIKGLRARMPKLRILILSMHEEVLYAERALRAGANGYMMKQESGQKLMEATRRILSGEVYVSSRVNERILERMSSGGKATNVSPVERLSDRELEVFQLIAQGYGTRQMAEALNVSMKTVETHREHIREKLQLASSFELLQYALSWVGKL